MSLWVAATLLAASAQALRFLLQKRLNQGGLSAAAATFARFCLAPPLLAAALGSWAASGGRLPDIGPAFWPWAILGGLAQIGATVLMVLLFARRNFAVGIAFSKTTVLMTAAFGAVALGETVTLPALLAMLAGLAGVMLLSVPTTGSFMLLNRSSLYGLGAGALFAISAVSYRAASLAVLSPEPLLRAAITLCLVTALQAALLAAWLGRREPGALAATLRRWRPVAATGLLSVIGSLGWFTAYTLETAAHVNAVGQVELIISVLIAHALLGERMSVRETGGIVLVGASVVALILLL